jgi:hypothetical protein
LCPLANHLISHQENHLLNLLVSRQESHHVNHLAFLQPSPLESPLENLRLFHHVLRQEFLPTYHPQILLVNPH